MTTQVDMAPSKSAACLDRYLASFESRLAERNYKPGTIKTYRVLVRRLASFMEAGGIAPERLTADLAARLVRGEERHRNEPNKCQNIARRFAEHLIELGVVPAPVPSLHSRSRAPSCAKVMRTIFVGSAGLSQRTIFHAWRFADRFLDHRFGNADIDLTATTAGDVIAFLQHVLSRKAPFRDKTAATHLRSFFQYLFKSAVTTSNLALSVPKVAQRRDVRLPRHLAPDQVEAVLASVRGNPKHGRRDYAMLLLMAAARPSRARGDCYPARRTSTGGRANCWFAGQGAATRSCAASVRSR